VSSNELRTIWWEDAAVCLIDQRALPLRIETIRCTTVAQTAQAITNMVVRGAPAIGCTAAYGMALAGYQSNASEPNRLLADLQAAKETLDAARPTAVNLAWATTRMLRIAQEQCERAIPALRAALLNEAHAIWQEDLDMCHAIGMHGAPLIPQRGQVLTHCNAGGLATAGYGTALAPIRTAHSAGRPLHVYVDETRPFLQGARLTAWELQQAGIPLTLITIDLSLPDGTHIPIEQRNPAEVTSIAGVQIAPIGVVAAHPAFDVTPADLISAIITEQGVLQAPYRESLRRGL